MNYTSEEGATRSGGRKNIVALASPDPFILLNFKK